MKPLLGFLAAGLIAAFAPAADAFETIETDTALKSVHLLTLPDRDTVKVQLAVHVGESDLTGPEGFAHYLEHLVMWHAEGGPKPGFNAHLWNATTSNRITNYWWEAPSADTDDLLRKSARVLEVPDLPADFMLRERNVVAREYDLRMRENPQGRLFERLGRMLYDDKPVSRSVIGTPESIASLAIEDVEAVHRRFYTASNASLVIVGNIGREAAIRLVNKHFANSPAATPPARAWRSDLPSGHERMRIVERDDEARNPSVFVRKLVRLAEPMEKHRLVRSASLLQELLGSALPGGLAGPLRFDDRVASNFQIRIAALSDREIELAFSAEPEAGLTLDVVAARFEQAIAELGRTGMPAASVKRMTDRAVRAKRRLAGDVDRQSRNALAWLADDLTPASTEDDLADFRAIGAGDIDRLLQAIAGPGRTVVGHLVPASPQGEPS